MENKLRAYMDHLFQDVPNTKKAVEVKEEILQNIVDKYHDLVAEGKSCQRKPLTTLPLQVLVIWMNFLLP